MRLSGRSLPYRVGRLLMSEARLDVPNDPACNGERLVQGTVAQYAQLDRKTVVFDVGANIGDWTYAMVEHAKNADLHVNPLRVEAIAQRVIAKPQHRQRDQRRRPAQDRADEIQLPQRRLRPLQSEDRIDPLHGLSGGPERFRSRFESHYNDEGLPERLDPEKRLKRGHEID